MADTAPLPVKDPLAVTGIAAFLEKLCRHQVPDQAAHLLMAERRLGLTGAERVVPQGRGEIGEAVRSQASRSVSSCADSG